MIAATQRGRLQGSFWIRAFGVFILALTLRCGYLRLALDGTLTTADSAAYTKLADDLKLHGRYSSHTGAGPGGFPADLQRPPGYP